MNIFFQQLINALTYGSLLGFIALGYTMVYGILKLINFAHGDLVTLSVFLMIAILPVATSINIWMILLSLIGVIVIISVVATMVEELAYRPLRKEPRLSLIVTALGAGMVIQNAVMLIWGPNPRIFPNNIIPDKNILIGSIEISYLSLLVLGLNLIIMFTLNMFINRTRTGIAIKALQQDYQTAQLMGVNVNRIIIVVFIVGSILGALGGILIGASYKSVSFNMGFNYGLKAFIAAIIGGIDSIPGAMFGGLVIGITQTLSAGYISSAWADTFTYALLILILVLRPNGLFSEKKAEKV